MTWPLAEAAHHYPQAIAYDGPDGCCTYEELMQAVERRIARLQGAGVGPGEFIAMKPGNDLATLESFWALLGCGSVACPISPRFPPDKRRSVGEMLRAVWLQEVLDRPSARRRCEIHFDPRRPATVILSSGSTGEPKAVVHCWQAHAASAAGAARNMPLAVGDRWLWSLPSYHVSGLSIWVRCAVAGATVCGMGASDSLDASLLQAARITHLSVVATQLQRLLRQVDSFPANYLKSVLVGGSAVSTGLLQQSRDRRVPVHVTYGLTELASQVATGPIANSRSPSMRTSGHVLPHCEVRVDEQGQICVRSAAMCSGYLCEGRLVAVADDEGWFETGDLGTVDEAGYLMVTGRRDNMFISGGENIHPETIERALLELPEIEQAVVVPREDAEFGARPVAFVVSEQWDIERWRSVLSGTLRKFELPVAFVALPEAAGEGLKPSRTKLMSLARQSLQQDR